MESLVVQNISHSFSPEHQVLDSISFTLQKGKVTSILGESGCGKTTILQICANLLEATHGDIKNTFHKSSVVFQEPRLLPWQNVIDNISLPLLDSGLSKKEIQKNAQDMALLLGLSVKDFSKYPKDLSGGMKQRVSFARALVTQPTLLFLDEPFSALDIGLKREIYDILLHKVVKNKLGILFITHDLMESLTLSHEILVLKPKQKGSQIASIYNFDVEFHARDDAFLYKNILPLTKEFEKRDLPQT